jgi:pilus assembly protein Flp/PilA
MLDYLNSEDGAAAAEYAVILAVLGMGLAAAMFALGPPIASRFSAAATVINAPNGQSQAAS